MTAGVGDTVVVHADEWAYISHPSICVLADGSWLAAFNHSRRRRVRHHPPSDPLFRTLLSRSADDGRTWSDPTFAPDFDWSGTECPGIAQLSTGTVVLTQFRFGWYPLGLAKKRRAAGEKISICLPDVGWTEDFGDDDWVRAQHTWARGYHGLYAHRSTDGAETFETVKIGTGGMRDGYTRAPVKELADGRLAYAVTEHHPPSNRFTYLVTSADDGRSWSAPTVIVDDLDRERFSEPDVAETAPGELLCVLRARRSLFACRSTDGGQTWSTPEPTGIGGCPGHLLPLADGRLACTFGRRWEPFGIRLVVSDDGGRTWGDEIVVRDDLPNGDLGYPTTIEPAAGRLFVCYYGQTPEGVTCVMATRLEL